MPQHILAIDVGTGSARAGIFDPQGRLLARDEIPIHMNNPVADHAEHDSENIWESVCRAARAVVAKTKILSKEVVGIGFDATCSLVVRDRTGRQLGVSSDNSPRWDTIVWLDHRAKAEAEECTKTRHRVLNYIGGVMSPEMEVPKLMWLKRHMPEAWEKAGYFFDLADFLTWKSSGSLDRSQCTLTCKWTYLAHEKIGWQRDFFHSVGLADAFERGRLPEIASPIGSSTGPLTARSAEELGLTTSCRVGVGIIDAHAGALGTLGPFASTGTAIDSHLGLIAGTSSCLMALSTLPRPTHGVWGPYFGAALPLLWLNEGGQSATGALLDHIIRNHASGGEADAATHRRIAERVMQLLSEESWDLAGRLHVLPDFHGNRSPLADANAVGVLSGLTLDSSFDSLCRLYWRTAIGIALGVRHILDALNAKGFRIDTLHVTGGHTKNPILMQLYADVTGCNVLEHTDSDAVLLGTAMLAAAAGGLYPSLTSACEAMRQPETMHRPNLAARPRFDRDYRVFLEMHRQRRALDAIGDTSAHE
jgi:FGGY-family pentulose kinase